MIVLPHGTYPEGTRVLGPANVAQGLTGFTLSLDRDEWLAGVSLALTVDLSLDNGATWNNPHPQVDPYPVSLTAVGGVALDKFGAAYPTTMIEVPLPQPSSTTRKIRATMVVVGGSLTATGNLTLT